MTALLFDAAGRRYGLDVSQIIEVVPAVELRAIAGVPAYVAGVLRYRGALVPVIDVNRVLCGAPVRPRYSTRLVLVRYTGLAGTEHALGLLVEGAARGVVEELGHLTTSGVATPDAPYLGQISTDRADPVQLVRVEHLIPEELRDRLFVEA